MKENSIEELKQELEELYRTQQARLDVGADDLDIREEIAEVEEEIKELQDETMEENSIKNEGSSIKEDMERLELCSTNQCNICGRYEKEECMLERNRCEQHILSDYKRILKENEKYRNSDYETICLENNELREITDRIQSEYNDLLKDNFKLKNELETKRKEYQEIYKDVREELRELKKENEELKQDRNNNYQMIALAQNEALGYMQGYEDAKKLKRGAVANIVENQQYYIIKKQIEKYKTYIEQLRKELGQKDKIIDLMAEQINNHDIDEDICKQMGQKANCNEFEDTEKCKEYIKQYFESKAK